MKKEENKRYTVFSLALGLILLMIIVLVSVRDSNTITEFRQNLPNTFICMIICIGMVFPLFCVVFMLLLFLDNNTVQTKFHLLAQRISAKITTRNSNEIYPYLQSFVYEVLKRNKETICIPIGQDVSTLPFNGYNVRYGSVFYRFSLVTPEKPIHEIDTLKQIIQSYLNQELNSYGIYGLNAIYRSKTVTCCSIYVDRLFYDEDNNSLIFDILYVCTENSANYYQSALQRDKKIIKPERVVYDDEV